MKTRIPIAIAASLLVLSSVDAIAQQEVVPKMEFAGGYSYVNFHPSIPQLTSQNLNGGGGAFVYNITKLIGIKADFQGYAFGTGWTTKLINQGYPVTGSASGNLFTYMFGPQFKMHSGKFQPFGEGLFGSGHSNGYGSVLLCISDPTSCNLSNGHGNNNAFAMEWGGGLDLPVSQHVQLRPVEVDYLYTNFSSNHVAHIANSQNSFKYFVGVNFTLGSIGSK